MRLALGVAGLVLLIAVGLPLGLLAAELVAHPGALGAMVGPLEIRAAGNTVALALGTTAFALAAGVPLGVVLGRVRLPALGALRVLATLPYVVPPYVTAIAWIALLNPTNGWLNQVFRAVGLPALDIYGLPGMIWVLGLESTPLVMLATADALGRMDASLEEQARIAGAGPLGVLRRVTLPLAWPAIATAAAAVLAGSAAAFGVPYLLAAGSADPDFVLTTRIAVALDLDPASGRPRAVALSGLLLALSIGAPALLALVTGRRSHATVTGKASRPAALELGRWAPLALSGVVGFVAVGAALPVAALIALSVTGQVGRGFGPDNWSLAHYVDVLGRPANLAALGHSLGWAAGAATAATAFGALVAVIEVRGGSRAGAALAWAARAPYMVPGTVLALGLLLAWSQEVRLVVLERVTFALALADTGWLLVLAWSVKFLALPVGGIGAALRGVDPALEEAARIAGAGPWGALRRVTLPIVRPTLVSAWFTVFVPAFTEVTMAVLLAGPRSRVAGVLLFELQSYGDPPSAAALAVIVAGIAVAGQALAARASAPRT